MHGIQIGALDCADANGISGYPIRAQACGETYRLISVTQETLARPHLPTVRPLSCSVSLSALPFVFDGFTLLTREVTYE